MKFYRINLYMKNKHDDLVHRIKSVKFIKKDMFIKF